MKLKKINVELVKYTKHLKNRMASVSKASLSLNENVEINLENYEFFS